MRVSHILPREETNYTIRSPYRVARRPPYTERKNAAKQDKKVTFSRKKVLGADPETAVFEAFGSKTRKLTNYVGSHP